jgi:hypothetical protein
MSLVRPTPKKMARRGLESKGNRRLEWHQRRSGNFRLVRHVHYGREPFAFLFSGRKSCRLHDRHYGRGSNALRQSAHMAVPRGNFSVADAVCCITVGSSAEPGVERLIQMHVRVLP